MSITFEWLPLLAAFVVAVAAFVITKAAEVAITQEYDIWAPKLARVLIRVAGSLCPTNRKRWEADLLFVQRVEKNSALVEAVVCLLTAPFLTVATAVQAACHRQRRRVVTTPRLGPQHVLEIEILRSAISALRHFPAGDRALLQKHIEALATEPRPTGYETVLADFCRIRVDRYRIVYEIQDDERLITVTHIARRPVKGRLRQGIEKVRKCFRRASPRHSPRRSSASK